MIVRLVSYHALSGKDVQGWLRGVASEVRGVTGMRHVEFMRSLADPSQYAAAMHFQAKADLDNYKATGPYQSLVKSLRQAWLDESKPVNEQIFEVLDI